MLKFIPMKQKQKYISYIFAGKLYARLNLGALTDNREEFTPIHKEIISHFNLQVICSQEYRAVQAFSDFNSLFCK